ncbi:MAG: Ldh family oxidoreductase [Bacteroidia bacterium]|nr:Ldh family oxidoreductase [Bacteroidia bacterium]
MSAIYSRDQLYSFTKNILLKIGHSNEHAQLAADVLLAADIRGIDSHGVARLSGYVRLWEKNRVNAKPNMKVIHETPSTATVDADAALGLISAPFAMNIAIEKAKQCGSGWVSVMNSNHFGIAGYHSMMALNHDMIGFAMTNASPLVAPTFSKERLLGTNPISVAIPALKEKPFVLDMATSSAANGKLEIAQREGKSIPLGWVQDKEGNDSTDANAVKNGGALLPLGSSHDAAGHKGYGLGALVDIMSAVLGGANYGPWVPPFVAFLDPLPDLPGKGLGHFVGAMRIDAFRPAADFKKHMDNWIQRFKSAPAIDIAERVLIPGEPEFSMTEYRLKNGIPLNGNVVKDLAALGERFNISL